MVKIKAKLYFSTSYLKSLEFGKQWSYESKLKEEIILTQFFTDTLSLHSCLPPRFFFFFAFVKKPLHPPPKVLA